MTQVDDGQDLVDQLLESEAADIGELRRRDFLPWHKPRKQVIRIQQWYREIEKLVVELSGRLSGRTFKYMSLPGDDLLDLRVLVQLFEQYTIKLQYLGYNTIHSRTVRSLASNLAENQLKSNGAVYHEGSTVIADRFESLSLPNSVARLRANMLAPFDVVNLDLCDSVVGDGPETRQSTLEALRCILDLQKMHRSDPWLLFITTRVDRASIDERVFALLYQKLIENAASSELFKRELQAKLNLAVDAIEAALASDVAVSSDQVARSVCVAIGKWILGIMRSNGGDWDVHLLKSYYYSVTGNGPDLMSLTFRIERNVGQISSDPMSLTRATTSGRTQKEEPVLACQYIKSISGAIDVDAQLLSDNNLLNWAIAESKKLLQQASYDVDRYDAWLRAL